MKLVIDPDELTLDPRTIVKHTDDGGYLCLGFGSSAEFLREVDNNSDFEVIDQALGQRQLGRSEDPFLRKLNAAVALAKEFDPDQPRDEQGRWTSEGEAADGATAASAAPATDTAAATAGAAAASVAGDVLTSPALGPALRQFAARALATAAGVAAGSAATAALVLGFVCIPLKWSSGISEGSVEDAPDLGYRFDQATGHLRLSCTNEDGSEDILYSGRVGTDGLFRDNDGNVIGRRLDGSVIVDPDAVPGYESRAKSKDRAQTGARARVDAIADTVQPKLCPAPTEESTAGRSERTTAYQSQISKLPVGLEVKWRGVRFDGCREEGDTIVMLEAKGPGFAQHMDGAEDWKGYYTGLGDTLQQMRNQSEAAGAHRVEWHVAEAPFAEYLRQYALAQGYANIVMIHTPAVRQ